MSPARAGLIRARTLRNVLSLLAGRSSAVALQFVAFAVMAASVGAAGTGTFTVALAIVSLFQVGASAGLHAVAQRDVAQDRSLERTLVPNLLYLRTLLGAATYAAIAAFIVAAPFSDDVILTTLTMGLAILALGLEAPRLCLEVRLRMGAVAVAQALQAVLALAGALILAATGGGVLEFAWLYVFTNLARVGVVWVAGLRVTDGLDWRPRPSRWLPLTRVALPIAAASLITMSYTRLDLIVLGAVASAADAGQYGVAYRFFDTLVILAAVAQAAAAPVLATSWTESASIFQRRLRSTSVASLAIAAPLSIGGAMVAWRLVPAIPGMEEYAGAGVALSVLCGAYALVFVGHHLFTAFVVSHNQRFLWRMSLAGLAVNVVLISVLIPAFGYMGAAVATVATEVVMLTVALLVLRRVAGLTLGIGYLPRIAGVSATTAAPLALTYVLSPMAQALCGMAGFLCGIAAFRLVERDDVMALIKGTTRREQAG